MPHTAGHHPFNTPLNDYLRNKDDSRLPQRLAESSVLPYCKQHEDPSYRGRIPSEIGTSRVVNGTNISTNSSLPCFTDSASVDDESVSSFMGEMAVDHSFRILAEEEHAGPGTYNDLQIWPAMRSRRSDFLECPFECLSCILTFHGNDLNDWIDHSLDHFAVQHGPSSRRVEPPKSNACPFCDWHQEYHDGREAWTERMIHVAKFHHQIGHTLAHARPDFALFRYLWEQGIIDNATYSELRGDRSRHPLTQALSQETVAADEDRPQTTSVVNERRRDRPRRPNPNL